MFCVAAEATLSTYWWFVVPSDLWPAQCTLTPGTGRWSSFRVEARTSSVAGRHFKTSGGAKRRRAEFRTEAWHGDHLPCSSSAHWCLTKSQPFIIITFSWYPFFPYIILRELEQLHTWRFEDWKVTHLVYQLNVISCHSSTQISLVCPVPGLWITANTSDSFSDFKISAVVLVGWRKQSYILCQSQKNVFMCDSSQWWGSNLWKMTFKWSPLKRLVVSDIDSQLIGQPETTQAPCTTEEQWDTKLVLCILAVCSRPQAGFT